MLVPPSFFLDGYFWVYNQVPDEGAIAELNQTDIWNVLTVLNIHYI